MTLRQLMELRMLLEIYERKMLEGHFSAIASRVSRLKQIVEAEINGIIYLQMHTQGF